MPSTCVIKYEYTDTFAGEANYNWVERGKIYCKEGEIVSDLAALRRVKKKLGISGIRCKTDNIGGLIMSQSIEQCIVVFITIEYFNVTE